MSNLIQDNRGYIAGGVAVSALYPAARAVGFGVIFSKVKNIENAYLNEHFLHIQFPEAVLKARSEVLASDWKRPLSGLFGETSFGKKWRAIIQSVDTYSGTTYHVDLAKTYLLRNLGWVAGIFGAAGLVYVALKPEGK